MPPKKARANAKAPAEVSSPIEAAPTANRRGRKPTSAIASLLSSITKRRATKVTNAGDASSDANEQPLSATVPKRKPGRPRKGERTRASVELEPPVVTDDLQATFDPVTCAGGLTPRRPPSVPTRRHRDDPRDRTQTPRPSPKDPKRRGDHPEAKAGQARAPVPSPGPALGGAEGEAKAGPTAQEPVVGYSPASVGKKRRGRPPKTPKTPTTPATTYTGKKRGRPRKNPQAPSPVVGDRLLALLDGALDAQTSSEVEERQYVSPRAAGRTNKRAKMMTPASPPRRTRRQARRRGRRRRRVGGVGPGGYLADAFYEGDADLLEREGRMDAVVKVFCTHTEPNYSLPWQRKRQSASTSSGSSYPAEVSSTRTASSITRR